MAKIGRPQNTEADFWPLVTAGKHNECWHFEGTLDRDGYGKFRLIPEGLAHRVMYRLRVGVIPTGVHVLHTCDNPRCCNPSHLFLGSPSVNMQDMWDKKRHRRLVGENNNHAKLTSAKVTDIRNRYSSGETQVSLAKEFNVSQSNISEIVLRKIWIE